MSNRAASTAATVVLALAVAALGVDACTCFNGGAVATTTPCTCSCPGAYAQPQCEWNNTARIEVVIVFRNTSTAANPFSTGAKADEIRIHYNVSAATGNDPDPYDAERRLISREPADKSELHVLFTVRGDLVYPLLRDGDAGPAQWMIDIGVIRVTRYVQAEADASVFAGSPIVFTVDAGGSPMPFQWDAISWAVGAVILVILLPVVEAIFSALCYNAAGGIDESDLKKDDDHGSGANPLKVAA